MFHNNLQVCLEQMAHRYALRWTQPTKRYLGLHRGIVVDASVHEDILTIAFSSPTAAVGELVLEDFGAFRHCAEAGLPTAWIKGRMEDDGGGRTRVSDHSCLIWIDQQRMAEIGEDLFLRLPDIIAVDLHTRGASGTWCCDDCGKNEATTVGLLNYVYTALCDVCWNRAVCGGRTVRVIERQRVNWRRVLPLLAVVTGVGAYGWGYIQQSERLDELTWNDMLWPVLWAFGLCWVIYWRRIPVTRGLRLLLFGSVIASVLLGNIWGFRSRLIDEARKQFNQQVIGPDWPTSAKLYFAALPQRLQWEAPFLLGGLAGAWIALRTLKRPETLDVQ